MENDVKKERENLLKGKKDEREGDFDSDAFLLVLVLAAVHSAECASTHTLAKCEPGQRR